MYKKQAMILAAGFGTRMGELTKTKPKPLLPIAGYPMITYSLFLLYLWQVDSVVINLHYQKEKIKEYLKNFPYFRIFFSEEEILLGTAGGISYAIYQNFLDDYFLVINSDILLFPSLNPFTFLPDIQKRNLICVLFLKEKDQEHQKEKGFVLKKKIINNIYKINLSNLQSIDEYYYIGLSFFHQSFFDYYKKNMMDQEKHSIDSIFKKELLEVMQNRELYGILYEGIVLDCGSKQKYEVVNHAYPIIKELIPESLHQEWQKFIKGWKFDS
ncbi:MAG: sugar phosphate nucleotidyltransferase [Leptospiraceae bacterium]|nr:sugar phosphate nucleotidyltransferase [Leptospiraceae bacterium]MDW7976318.1 sugar phosphate nucleotidyltransferase [Leptospiraceae bacterium]